MIPPSSLVHSQEQPGAVQTCARTLFVFSSGWTVGATCVLREVRGATAAVALWAMASPSLKVRSDEVQDGPSWRAKQQRHRAFHLSLKQWLHVQPPPLREHGLTTPHVPPSFLLWALRIKEAYSTIIESNAFLMVSTILSFGP